MTAPTEKTLPSERSFGVLFTIVFAGIACYGLFLKNWSHFYLWVFASLSALILIVTLLAPQWLRSFNRAWFYLGEFLGKIVSPIVLGVIFFLLITPVAFIGRLFGRDELRLKRKPVSSYWVDRTPPGPEADSFKNQF
jgi:hypothetical protein